MPYSGVSDFDGDFGVKSFVFNLVGAGRFERPTPCAQERSFQKLHPLCLILYVYNNLRNLLFAQKQAQGV
jgi:hypothetical protein